MSPLRALLARPGRRDGGGRHGRPGTRPLPHHGGPRPARLLPEARIRPRLLCVCVPPAVAAALGGTVAVLFTLHSTGARPTAALWAVLGCAAALAAAAVAAAVLGADRAARSVLERCNALRRATARRQDELHGVVEQLRRGERPPVRQPPPPVPEGDDFDLLAHELGRAHEAAVATAVQASRLSSRVGHEQKVEVFVNLARRLQSLVHREIQLLDELENAVEDPELLKGLFHVDHLATRVRRHAENLAVLGGAVSRRQWSHPVTMTEVLRSSIAEVEQYPRVKLVPPIDGTLRGHAVADVIHLLAELVENATLFSAPHTTVLLRAQYVTAGLAVEVEDRGLGMPFAEQEKMNALLCDPDQVNVAHLLQDGRIGLYVVSALARRARHRGTPPVQHLRRRAGRPGHPAGAPRRRSGRRAPARRVRRHGRHDDRCRDDRCRTGRRGGGAGGAPRPVPGPRPDSRRGRRGRTPAAPAPPRGAPAPDRAGAPAARGTRRTPGPCPPARRYRPAPPGGPAPPRVGTRVGTRVDDRGGARGPRVTGARPPRSRGPPHVPEPRSPADGPGPDRDARPRLPKRRAQEHLVPQLRDEPARRRHDDHTLHDPGLMAAFQRGIGLAEAAPPPPPSRPPPHRTAATRRNPQGVDAPWRAMRRTATPPISTGCSAAWSSGCPTPAARSCSPRTAW
ncbi:ATP-binding protein [Streptomyces somaliensis]|uniref:ATP-binding protein n=1 Tax=Streptomyces somaliensis TaxID=78355 RepID=UPI0027E4121C|nr:ATP-binding protein [Streptomyces somaliensis]